MKQNPKTPEYIAIIFGVAAVYIAVQEIMVMQFVDLAMEPLYAEREELERAHLVRKAAPFMFSAAGMALGYHYGMTQHKKSIGFITSATVFSLLLLRLISGFF